MTVLRDYYDSSDNYAGTWKNDRWYAQTFTPVLGFRIESVMLKVFRYSTPGNITVSIKATDENYKPTGDNLCSVTVDGNSFSEDTDGVWTTFTFDSTYLLSGGTMYAIVIRKTTTESLKWFYWRYDAYDATYLDGRWWVTDNSGTNWNFLSYLEPSCFTFRIYDALITPEDAKIYKRLVAAANNRIWYEDI